MSDSGSISETPAAIDDAQSRRDIYFEEAARDAIDEHVGGDTSVERGGVLVGSVDERTGRVIVSASIPAHRATSAVASLTFTHEAWDDVNEILADRYDGLKMVGWYHSHPRFGIFLSEYDLFIQNNFFSAPWQVAYVVDPVAGKSGFFGWENGNVVRYPVWTIIARGGGKSVREPERGSSGGGDSLPPPLEVSVERETPPTVPDARRAGPDPSQRKWIVGGISLVVAIAVALGLILYFLPASKTPASGGSKASQKVGATPGVHEGRTPRLPKVPSVTVQPSHTIPILDSESTATGLTETWSWKSLPDGGIYTVLITSNGPNSDETGGVANCVPTVDPPLTPIVPPSATLPLDGSQAACTLHEPDSDSQGLAPNSSFEFTFFSPTPGAMNPGPPTDAMYEPYGSYVTARDGVPPVSPTPIPMVPLKTTPTSSTIPTTRSTTQTKSQ